MTKKYNYTKKPGRPGEYKPEYCLMVSKYLEKCQDEEREIVKQRGTTKTGEYEMTDHKLTVKLPTVEDFGLFIGVPKRTIYEWRDKFPEFLHSLDLIVGEQQKRLINKGLSGDYNPTIAKLILSANHGMREKSDITTDDEKLPATQQNIIILSEFSSKDETTG